MCGIVGYIGERQAAPLLLDGLKRLEYRGYDSAGIAVVGAAGLEIVRSQGKLENLVAKMGNGHMPAGGFGIGHTRWATHGRPSEENAHPHRDCSGDVVVIHNGIIENYLELKRRLAAEGHVFATETDTEVVAHLVESASAGREPDDFVGAVAAALAELRGHYALVILSARQSGYMVAARSGPPLIVGLGTAGSGENFVASDIMAILPQTNRMVILEDGDRAQVWRDRIEVRDASGTIVERPVEEIRWSPVAAEKRGYKHFMLKEIHEQPQAVRDTFVNRLRMEDGAVDLGELGIDEVTLAAADCLHLVACGTSWHAALVAKFMIEGLARLPVYVDYGSEYRYRDPIVGPRTLAIGISQSGETADTLAAMQEAKGRGARLAAVVNVEGSSIGRLAKSVILTHAGPEIGVASTKAFTTQLAALFLLALHLRKVRGDSSGIAEGLAELARLPHLLEMTLKAEKQIEEIAKEFHRATDFLFLGRGINYPIALEGALKLKEISYIHAEGYPAGEMKHGPIALIDENMPIVALAPRDDVYEKTISNLMESRARDGILIAVGEEGDQHLQSIARHFIPVPRASKWLQPIVNVLPLQLLAYHIAVRRGCDVDQPRNLAKSVTVE